MKKLSEALGHLLALAVLLAMFALPVALVALCARAVLWALGVV